ncbi:MAG TPA: hypothetical protein VNJ52_02270 [Patescibacteria group bacterium]|nr:hypothetical protein [Patescibacteria group bacterium]
MRSIPILLLILTLASAAPVFAGSGEGKDQPAANESKAAGAAAPKGAAKSAAAAMPDRAAIASELTRMQQMIEEQAQELAAQRKQIEALERRIDPNGTATASLAASTAVPAKNSLSSASEAATPPAVESANDAAAGSEHAVASLANLTEPLPKMQEGTPVGVSPLQFHIGSAYITPIGFMDLTGVVRSVNGGSGIGTNFAGIPYGTASNYQNNLSEFRMSMQNSRIGFRIDANVAGGHVIGYEESDFLGAAPSNVAVSSNSNTFRSRLFWVDFRKGAWEFLGGQTWTLATPNRHGVSPLPGDVFFSDDFDTNYQLGDVWGRIPEFRVAYHFPQDKAAFAVAIDSPDQYMGGTNGSTTVTLPACCSYYANGEINAGGGSLGPPNRGPDIIAKFVVDPSKRFHGEIGGIARFFQTYNQTTLTTFSATGGAGFVNLDVGIFGALRVITHNYWSDGGGRYIFGQAPDLVVRAYGSPSLVHSGSTVDGFEYTHGNDTISAYYGLVYISRNVTLDTSGCPIGWGYYPTTTPACAGSSSGQNRNIQEGTINYSHTFWKSPRYGALTTYFQYSYLTRKPWYVAPGAPHSANASMGWFDLRYTLPGSAPTLGKN